MLAEKFRFVLSVFIIFMVLSSICVSYLLFSRLCFIVLYSFFLSVSLSFYVVSRVVRYLVAAPYDSLNPVG